MLLSITLYALAAQSTISAVCVVSIAVSEARVRRAERIQQGQDAHHQAASHKDQHSTSTA